MKKRTGRVKKPKTEIEAWELVKAGVQGRIEWGWDGWEWLSQRTCSGVFIGICDCLDVSDLIPPKLASRMRTKVIAEARKNGLGVYRRTVEGYIWPEGSPKRIQFINRMIRELKD